MAQNSAKLILTDATSNIHSLVFINVSSLTYNRYQEYRENKLHAEASTLHYTVQ